MKQENINDIILTDKLIERVFDRATRLFVDDGLSLYERPERYNVRVILKAFLQVIEEEKLKQ